MTQLGLLTQLRQRYTKYSDLKYKYKYEYQVFIAGHVRRTRVLTQTKIVRCWLQLYNQLIPGVDRIEENLKFKNSVTLQSCFLYSYEEVRQYECDENASLP